MKHYTLIVFLSCLVFAIPAKAQDLLTKLMPIPQQVNETKGKLLLDNSFKVAITGNPDARLYPCATRFLRRLDGRVGLFFQQEVLTSADNDPNATLVIKVNRPAVLKLYENETYSLSVNTKQIILSAETDLGALHGLETVLQMLSADPSGYYFPTCEIADSPRFAWRGLMIDAGRHFMPVDVIKRNIDGMMMVKMNVLHLHLSEDQGFRIESKVFPKLHELGSDGLYYSQEQIKDIIQYANERGIRVVPEFDIPGHSTSWCVGYPELASAPGPYKIERRFGVFNPTMDPTKESTYEFLDKFLTEMCQLFNDDYMHIGGDENNGKQWNENPAIQEFKKTNNMESNHVLQAYFNKHLLEILTRNNKKMIGWDEIMVPELPKTAIIQSWRGKTGLANAAKGGYQVILSNGYYIDLLHPAKEHYLNDPLPAGLDLTDDQKKLVMGGEATMWSELVTWETVDSRIWPRTAAIAERLWSPASVVNLESMYSRLNIISHQLEEVGLTHLKNVDMFLRRICKGEDIAPLKNLVGVLEPVKNYERTGSKEVAYRTFSPFTRVVDVATADAPDAMAFNSLVDAYLVSLKKEDALKLQQWMEKWRDNHASLEALIQKAPMLKEVEGLSLDLSVLSTTGLEALKMIEKRKKAKPVWVQQAAKNIEAAKVHRAQTQLVVIDGFQKLIDFASKPRS